MGNTVSVHCSNDECCLSDKHTRARDAQTQSCNNLGNPKIRNRNVRRLDDPLILSKT